MIQGFASWDSGWVLEFRVPDLGTQSGCRITGQLASSSNYRFRLVKFGWIVKSWLCAKLFGEEDIAGLRPASHGQQTPKP